MASEHAGQEADAGQQLGLIVVGGCAVRARRARGCGRRSSRAGDRCSGKTESSDAVRRPGLRRPSTELLGQLGGLLLGGARSRCRPAMLAAMAAGGSRRAAIASSSLAWRAAPAVRAAPPSARAARRAARSSLSVCSSSARASAEADGLVRQLRGALVAGALAARLAHRGAPARLARAAAGPAASRCSRVAPRRSSSASRLVPSSPSNRPRPPRALPAGSPRFLECLGRRQVRDRGLAPRVARPMASSRPVKSGCCTPSRSTVVPRSLIAPESSASAPVRSSPGAAAARRRRSCRAGRRRCSRWRRPPREARRRAGRPASARGRVSPSAPGRIATVRAPGEAPPGDANIVREKAAVGDSAAISPAPRLPPNGGHPGGGGPEPLAARRAERQMVGILVRAVPALAHRGGQFTLSVVPIWT